MGRMKDRGIQIDELLETIKEAMYANPSLRLGQLLSCAVGPTREYQYEGYPEPVCDLFYVEDDNIRKCVKEFAKKQKQQLGDKEF